MRSINSICLLTRDVTTLREFYAQLLQAASQGDKKIASFELDGVQLTICSQQIMEQMAPGSMQGAGRGACVMEIEVPDVDAEYQRMLALHIPIVKPPTTQAWGLRSLWLRDPDGNLVNFYARVADGKA